MKADAISIVEAAYDCESDARTWLDRLLEESSLKLDRGFGVAVSMYGPSIAPERTPTVTRQMNETVFSAVMGMCVAYPAYFHRANASQSPIGTLTKTLELSADDARAWPPFVQYMHPIGVRDVTGVVARDPSGYAIVLTAPMPAIHWPSRGELSIWSRITAHISAGARLRRALPSPPNDLSDGADAVLSPSGSIEHAEAGAQGAAALESLRHAAKAIDRARSKARSNEDEALELWQGLVAGRWSLIDRFDSDGRRFLVARKNDPDVMDPRALTLRERQVLAYAAMGHSRVFRKGRRACCAGDDRTYEECEPSAFEHGQSSSS